MRTIHGLLSASLLCAVFVASNAGAGEPAAVSPASRVAVNPGVIANFVNWTWVKGTIKVPAGIATGNLAGLACSDLDVVATSQAMNPVPPGGLFSSPKWVHSVKASGAWSSGTCSYAITVPPQQNFGVSVNGGGPNASTVKCYLLGVTVSPWQAGWFKLAVGTTKEQDFSVSGVACESPPA